MENGNDLKTEFFFFLEENDEVVSVRWGSLYA
jgi:hypothetical protein